jgi:excisionase family DNA binding protein
MAQKNDILGQLSEIKEILAEKDRQPLTLEEAASYLRLSKSYIYKLTSSGTIPHYKPEGKLIYFEKSELDDWLFRNRVSAAMKGGTHV